MFPSGSSQVKYRSSVIVTLHVALARNFVDCAGLPRDVKMFSSGSSWVHFPRDVFKTAQNMPKNCTKRAGHTQQLPCKSGGQGLILQKTTFQTLSKHLPREGEKLTRTLTRGLLDRKERERPHRNRRVGERPHRKRRVLQARERPDKSEGQVRHRQVGSSLGEVPALKKEQQQRRDTTCSNLDNWRRTVQRCWMARPVQPLRELHSNQLRTWTRCVQPHKELQNNSSPSCSNRANCSETLDGETSAASTNKETNADFRASDARAAAKPRSAVASKSASALAEPIWRMHHPACPPQRTQQKKREVPWKSSPDDVSMPVRFEPKAVMIVHCSARLGTSLGLACCAGFFLSPPWNIPYSARPCAQRPICGVAVYAAHNGQESRQRSAGRSPTRPSLGQRASVAPIVWAIIQVFSSLARCFAHSHVSSS